MPTRKIAEDETLSWQKPTCRSPEHNPPMHMVRSAGLWEHTCPSCGATALFRVRETTLTSRPAIGSTSGTLATAGRPWTYCGPVRG